MRLPSAACLLMLPLLVSPTRAGETAQPAMADFTVLCAPCHGADGKGDGPQARHLHRKPADLTRIAARNGGAFPAERVFETIAGLGMPNSHGTRDMPVWGDVFVSEDIGGSVKLEDAGKAADDATRRIAGLVAYIESIQAAP